MKVVKILMNGYPQGVYAITDKDEVTDELLDLMNEEEMSKESFKVLVEAHLEKGLALIPKTEKLFDWDEDLHGKFFTNVSD